jgi:CubicO group peptidase (beta-lactamase class C family)
MRQRNTRPGLATALAAFVASICVLLPQLAPGQSDTGNRALRSAVAALVREAGIKPSGPGIAVLAVKGGRVLLMEGYGLANTDSKEKITACTRFDLASVSKSMTATAVLMLQERGLLSINDDVRKYIPELPDYPDGPLRIRDLLHHVSGLTDYLELEQPKRNRSYWINTDHLPGLGKAPLDFPIGEKYEYNNTNYMLAGLLVERVAKKPFGDFMREAIFIPAGMTHTFVNSGPASIPKDAAAPCNSAVGYEKEDGEWVASWGFPPGYKQPDHVEIGDGGVWSNLEDMAKWDTALRTNKLLKPATMKLALTGSRRNKGYGLGWQLYHEDDGQLYGYGHNGYWSGFSSMYYNYLTNDSTVVLLSNRGNDIDLDDFWEKLSGLIDTHAKN